MWFYSAILFFSFIFPFALSFDKKVAFHTHWRTLLPAIVVVAVFFIAFDVLYTRLGVWGFNENFVLGIRVFNLPLEEILFFLLIPYASVFLHYVIKHYFPNLYFSKKQRNVISYALIGVLGVLAVICFPKLYTLYSIGLVILALLAGMADKRNEMGRFLITFIVILVPFLLVNGLLTGSFLGREVVWYDNAENCGIRILTIPVEDVGYAFGMLFGVIWMKGVWKKFFKK